MQRNYPIVIHKDRDTDYCVIVPDLPGCITAGDTLDDAQNQALEAIQCHIEGMLLDGEPVPEAKSNVQIMDNDIHNLTEQRLTGLKTKDATRYMHRLGIGIIFATLLTSTS
ncbi:hypothetical protein F4054_12480 [Candidatus Poribacteria bacterium]|nr:hypothetical protein [Candidatus Poribacteria bacterium]MYG08509.1 hypothetical protein [Candidatus Poribacteria bacterium]MYK23060.1 hypothetical protein [Candidatus Poribacteria bacterium]